MMTATSAEKVKKGRQRALFVVGIISFIPLLWFMIALFSGQGEDILALLISTAIIFLFNLLMLSGHPIAIGIWIFGALMLGIFSGFGAISAIFISTHDPDFDIFSVLLFSISCLGGMLFVVFDPYIKQYLSAQRNKKAAYQTRKLIDEIGSEAFSRRKGQDEIK